MLSCFRMSLFSVTEHTFLPPLLYEYRIYIILQYKGITKIVAGSFILVMIALLVVGLV